MELFLKDFFNGGKEHVELVTGRLLTPYQDHLLFDELCSQDLGDESRLFFPSDVRLSIRTAASLARACVRKLFCKQLRQYAPAPWGIGNGSMFAITKELFQKIGGFDEALKPTNGASACEDVDLFYRALLNGSLVAYSPKLVGYHYHGRFSEAAAKARAGEYFNGNINLATRHTANRYMRVLRLAMLAANV
jgi:GT2 family glycosyltransferase